MKTLFLYFNDKDDTIKTGALRVDGHKVPDMPLWKLFNLYTALVKAGHKVIKLPKPDEGVTVHLITY